MLQLSSNIGDKKMKGINKSLLKEVYKQTNIKYATSCSSEKFSSDIP